MVDIRVWYDMNRQIVDGLKVVYGIDGAGKTSVLSRLRSQGFYTCGWQDLLQVEKVWHLHATLTSARSIIHDMKPFSRSLFVATILWYEYEYLIAPNVGKERVIFCDSYYYRFYAKEKVYNKAHPILYHLLKMLPDPETVIYLKISPHEVLKRIVKPKEYEYLLIPENDDFVAFQNDILNIGASLFPENAVIEIDAQQPVEDVVASIMHHCIQVN
jgi:thymidylate kinase